MSEIASYSRSVLHRHRTRVAAHVEAHGHKFLLGLGGAALALSVISMADALATPIAPVAHDPRALAALGYGPRFADTAQVAILSLVKTYGAASAPQTGLFGLTQLAQSSSQVAPQAYRQLTPEQAQAINASIPISSEANPPARPFQIDRADVADHASAQTCLTAAIYYEAASESDDGEAAVAQVVLNRLRHPLFPKTVCGVVFEGSELPTGCQFTFTCDGSLNRRPSVDGWQRAEKIAARALSGYVMTKVGEATHYHTQWVVPYWQPTVTKLTQIGAHIFYRWSGDMGAPEAFHGRYAGFESPPGLVAGLDPRIVVTPAPAVLTVASAAQASQPVVALVRADQPVSQAASAPGATAPADSEIMATANTPRPAPAIKTAQAAPAPRASFFGHAPAAAPTRIGW